MRALFWFISIAVLCAACGGDGSKPRHPTRDAGAEHAAEITSDAAADAESADAAVEPPVSCEASAPRECPDPIPHYADVAPIFKQRCASCHNGQNGHWPLTAYDHVADWYGEIRAQMLACTMPPVDSGIAMPVAERQLILSWIRCGFPK